MGPRVVHAGEVARKGQRGIDLGGIGRDGWLPPGFQLLYPRLELIDALEQSLHSIGIDRLRLLLRPYRCGSGQTNRGTKNQPV